MSFTHYMFAHERPSGRWAFAIVSKQSIDNMRAQALSDDRSAFYALNLDDSLVPDDTLNHGGWATGAATVQVSRHKSFGMHISLKDYVFEGSGTHCYQAPELNPSEICDDDFIKSSTYTVYAEGTALGLVSKGYNVYVNSIAPPP